MSGLFSTMNISKRGMYVQQKSIDVTSHNIANASTNGYSRQRVTVETSRPITISGQAGQLGTGAQVAAIERVRDSFLDYQVRSETSTLGKYDSRAQFLHEVESILNEPSETGISTLFGKFFDAFQELSKNPNSSNARTVVAQQTLALTNAINSTYTQLEKLQINSQELTKSNVNQVNNILDQIQRLNHEIVQVTHTGNSPNDLMDKRDLLLDELSYKFNITVDKKAFNGIEIKPTDSGSIKYPALVSNESDGSESRFSYISNMEPKKAADGSWDGSTYVITYYKKGDMTDVANMQTLTVTNLDEAAAKQIKQTGILWGDSTGQAIRADGYPLRNGAEINASQLMTFKPGLGEINGITSVQSDVQDYMDQLDKLAKTVALAVNTIHGSTAGAAMDGSVDKKPFFVNGDTAQYDNGIYIKGTSIESGINSINAKNITINKELLNDVMKINVGTYENSGEGDGARALAIAGLRDALLRIQDMNSDSTREDLFDNKDDFKDPFLTIPNAKSGMKINSFFKDIVDRLGIQCQESKRMVINQEDLLYSLEESRLSVSGVSLDEEMANLVQFQHAYNANAKMISTIDELLDVVVNGLKR